jgi:peptide methionine sulfoxide reductase MsrA
LFPESTPLTPYRTQKAAVKSRIKLQKANPFAAQQSLSAGQTIVTEIKAATTFWPAEKYHQVRPARLLREGTHMSLRRVCVSTIAMGECRFRLSLQRA